MQGLSVPLPTGEKPLFEAPSYLRVAIEVSSGIFLYDLLFYPFHFSFHKACACSTPRKGMRDSCHSDAPINEAFCTWQLILCV